MSVKVYIDYKLFGSSGWETVEFSPENYFDLDPGEEIEYDCVPDFSHAIDYLDIDITLVSHTRVRVTDNELKKSRTTNSAFWNQGNNSITRRVDEEIGIVDKFTVISMKISDNPPVWETLRIQEDNDVPIIEFHSFITDQDDGTETEEVIYPMEN
jgi:hypothetical protein